MLKKVLIVEDDHFLRTFLQKKLEDGGYVVAAAEDGVSAIKELTTAEQKPDLVLLDLLLPGKTGFEILDEMKKTPDLSGIPVVVVSNLGQAKDVEQAKSLGASQYFIKADLSIDQLLVEVQKIIGV